MKTDKKFNHGVSLLKENQLEKALRVFNELIEHDSKNAKYYSERGVVFFHLQQKKESLFDMDKAVELEPTNSYRYSSRAYIRGHFKMLNEAIEDYRKAIDLDPDDAIAYNNLGLLEEQLGYQQRARESFSKADLLAKTQIDGRKEMNIKGQTLKAFNLQEKIDQEKAQSSFWKEMISLSTKDGLKSFFLFIRSGLKKW